MSCVDLGIDPNQIPDKSQKSPICGSQLIFFELFLPSKMKLKDTEIRGDSDMVYEMIKITVRYNFCSAKGEMIN